MKRSEFFAEMGKGLFKTVKEVTSPFISDDLDKIDSIMDDFIGLKWYEIGAGDSLLTNEVYDFFIAGRTISIINSKHSLKAFNRICPNCKTMTQWLAYEKVFKCLICEDVYHVEEDNGELVLKKYPLKKESGKWYIGIN